ncbi:MAG: F0F1 ATP synthase subunit B [Betaproteobacteria bacterium]|nr:F0F1 ATP synthase subunit B [Betaproteobacteria bacterium]MDE2622450.1 F0F1 ATP synthase subunit B [Betaproteobacteria bacterium]
MTFDWTTFLLEILNFLVLVWILKRFLYAPVLAVLDARRQRLLDEAAKAEQLQRQAGELKTGYESRLAQWEKEREGLRQSLDGELEQARAAGMEKLKQSLADAEAKARARTDALATAREQALVREAATEAYGAAAAMLGRLASPALTARIADVFAEDLAALPEADRAVLRRAAAALEAGASAEIAMAHDLDEGSRGRVVAALTAACDRTLPVVFREVPELLAGLRATVGECLLQANLSDELAFFRRHG